MDRWQQYALMKADILATDAVLKAWHAPALGDFTDKPGLAVLLEEVR